jgi:glutathione S-transferase
MEETELNLWGMGTVRNFRVHWMLKEMKLDYTFHPVHPRSGETYTEEFLKINPRRKVPVLNKIKTPIMTLSVNEGNWAFST